MVFASPNRTPTPPTGSQVRREDCDAPADTRAKLYAEIAKALAHPQVRDRLRNLADPMPLTSERYAALVKQEIETNTQLAKAAAINVN